MRDLALAAATGVIGCLSFFVWKFWKRSKLLLEKLQQARAIESKKVEEIADLAQEKAGSSVEEFKKADSSYLASRKKRDGNDPDDM